MVGSRKAKTNICWATWCTNMELAKGSLLKEQSLPGPPPPEFHVCEWKDILHRSSSREVRIRVPTFFLVVYFSRGTLAQKRGEKGTTGGPSRYIDTYPHRPTAAHATSMAPTWCSMTL